VEQGTKNPDKPDLPVPSGILSRKKSLPSLEKKKAPQMDEERCRNLVSSGKLNNLRHSRISSWLGDTLRDVRSRPWLLDGCHANISQFAQEAWIRSKENCARVPRVLLTAERGGIPALGGAESNYAADHHPTRAGIEKWR